MGSGIARSLRLFLCVLGMAGSFIFSTLPTWNPRLGGPAVARIVVSASAFWRLAPLWRAVTGAVPEVILPAAVLWRDGSGSYVSSIEAAWAKCMK